MRVDLVGLVLESWYFAMDFFPSGERQVTDRRLA